jgi:hypothetical protein
MADGCVLWKHLAVTLQSEAGTRLRLPFDNKVALACGCKDENQQKNNFKL